MGRRKAGMMTLYEILKKDGIEVEDHHGWYTGKTAQGKTFTLEMNQTGRKFNIIISGVGQKTRCNLDTVRMLLRTN